MTSTAANAIAKIQNAHKQRAVAGLTRMYTTRTGSKTVIANASPAMAEFNDYKFALHKREFETGEKPTAVELAELERLNSLVYAN